MLNTKLLGSVSAAPAEYVEDVFSTFLFTGNASSVTVNNGVDLAGEGGMVWLKGRNANDDHVIYDTARGSGYPRLYPNKTNAQDTAYPDFGSFNSNGFTIGYNSDGGYSNASGTNYASWAFRKAPKFFDVVTYTGNGSTSRLISHSLGSVPGMILIKRTSGTSNWTAAVSLSDTVYGIGGGGGGSGYETALNRIDPYYDNPLKSTIATNTTVDVPKVYFSDQTVCNASGATYVMYLFASNAGGFGAAGTDNVISCGGYVGQSSDLTVTLGYEPQFLIIKAVTAGSNWYMVDTMRGLHTRGTIEKNLNPNGSSSEGSDSNRVSITSTGFVLTGANGTVNSDGNIYTYMAIRRPMKVPTSGTQVFNPVAYAGSGAGTTYTTDFPVDTTWVKSRNATGQTEAWDRLRGSIKYLLTDSADAEGTAFGTTPQWLVDRMTSVRWNATDGYSNSSGTNYVAWNFKRATGFFDQVCYTGTGSARTVAHNLGAVPELMIVKGRNVTGEPWTVYAAPVGNTKYLSLNGTSEAVTSSLRWNDTTPTSTVFTVGSDTGVNWSTYNYVAYLFASVAGVSKVGSYTGNGSSQTINCGFTAGARFVMVKATSTTGDWVVVDTARGLVSGNDPFLQLNSTAAEITNEDILDPDSSGFVVNETTESINASGVSYIFLAIA